MKTFTFNAWVVAGFTPITRGSTLDYYINRPQGMKGYIINLTLRGQARAKAGDGFLLLEGFSFRGFVRFKAGGGRLLHRGRGGGPGGA